MRPFRPFPLRGLLLGSLVLACLHANAAPVVSLAAAPNPVFAGSTFTLSVNAAGFTDLYAWQFSVDFEPALFQALAATEGSFLATAGSTFFDGGVIDNAAGRVSFSFDTLVGAVPGASGSGLLETLTFRSVAARAGSFSLSDVAFFDSNLAELAPTTTSLSVSAVPEPSLAGFLLAGLAVTGLAAMGSARRTPSPVGRQGRRTTEPSAEVA